MAAPIRKTYGTLMNFFNRSISISRLVEDKTLSSICKNCSSCSAAVMQNVNGRSMFVGGKEIKGYISTIKGNNSSMLYKQHFYQNIFTQPCVSISNRISSVIKQCNHVGFHTKPSHISIRAYSKAAENRETSRHVAEDAQADKDGREVKENVYTVPNLLTMSRIVLTPVIGYFVVEESFTIAFSLFAFAGLTDMLDGFIARNFKNQMSAFGTALDPLADKILITVLTVTLTAAELLPLPLAALIIGRDVLLIVTGFIIRYVSLPPPKTFKRYFDITNPTAKLLPSTLSKVNTFLQLFLVSSTLAAPVFDFVNHPALQCLWYLTAATTFCSGIGYVINRKTSIQYLKKGA